MKTYIALLRAINVGGNGKLPMGDLRSLCEEAGFSQVQTYIQSGNVVFNSGLAEGEAKLILEEALVRHLGKPVGVSLRDSEQMRQVLEAAPFPDADPAQVAILFLNETVTADLSQCAKGQTDEKIVAGIREMFIHYPNGMGRSKLKLPVMTQGTARNLNTVAKLVAMAQRPSHPQCAPS